MSSWADYRQLGALDSWSDGDPTFASYWTEIFDRCARGEIDTWDYQWTFACWAQQGLTCLPAKNLVTNIGFGPGATHTIERERPSACLATGGLEFRFATRPWLSATLEADRFTHINHFGRQTKLPVRRIWTMATVRKLVKELPVAAMLLAHASRWRTAKTSDAH